MAALGAGNDTVVLIDILDGFHAAFTASITPTMSVPVPSAITIPACEPEHEYEHDDRTATRGH